MLNPLLVQLFGRDVVDRLERAGLETDEAVGRLAPEELSRRAGIAPDVARRVAALAVELGAPAARPRSPRSPRSAAPRLRSAGAGARAKSRKSDRAAPPGPAAPEERAVALSPVRDLLEELEVPELQESPREIDAFVDEAGLIAWMGFAARGGSERSLLSGVADGIIEPAPAREEASPQPAVAVPARTRAVTLEGSFWSFGCRPHGGAVVSPSAADAGRPEVAPDDAGLSPAAPAFPVPFHRRRSHDGH